MSGSEPKAPDPVLTAQAQSQYNKETAISQAGLNMYNQINPYGQTTYDQIGTWEDGTPQFQQTTTFSPEQQAIFDQTQQTQQNLANLATQQSGALAQHLGNNFSFTNDDAAQWSYDLASPRILQQQGQNESALRSTLAAKGIREGSAAWDAEMSRLTNANTDQLNQLALQGRSQAYNEAFNNYTAPINTITALMSGSQVGSPASASPATPQTAVANTDYSGLVQQNYKNQVDAYNAKAGGIGGLFGNLAGAAMGGGGWGSLFKW